LNKLVKWLQIPPQLSYSNLNPARTHFDVTKMTMMNKQATQRYKDALDYEGQTVVAPK
jgi:hypothetical protein